MEPMDKGLKSTKMGADKSAENTPNAPKHICPNCLPSPKVCDFDKKGFIGRSQSVIKEKGDIIKYSFIYLTA